MVKVALLIPVILALPILAAPIPGNADDLHIVARNDNSVNFKRISALKKFYAKERVRNVHAGSSTVDLSKEQGIDFSKASDTNTGIRIGTGGSDSDAIDISKGVDLTKKGANGGEKDSSNLDSVDDCDDDLVAEDKQDEEEKKKKKKKKEKTSYDAMTSVGGGVADDSDLVAEDTKDGDKEKKKKEKEGKEETSYEIPDAITFGSPSEAWPI